MYIQAQIPNTLLPSTGISNLTFNIFFISLSLSQLKEQQHFYIGGDSGCHSVQLSSPSRRNLTGRPGFSEPFPEMLWKAPEHLWAVCPKGSVITKNFLLYLPTYFSDWDWHLLPFNCGHPQRVWLCLLCNPPLCCGRLWSDFPSSPSLPFSRLNESSSSGLLCMSCGPARPVSLVALHSTLSSLSTSLHWDKPIERCPAAFLHKGCLTEGTEQMQFNSVSYLNLILSSPQN